MVRSMRSGGMPAFRQASSSAAMLPFSDTLARGGAAGSARGSMQHSSFRSPFAFRRFSLAFSDQPPIPIQGLREPILGPFAYSHHRDQDVARFGSEGCRRCGAGGTIIEPEAAP